MAIRKVMLDGDEVLRKNTRKIEFFDEKLAKLLDDMRETMIDADGVGLAAPQVGILRKLAVVEVGELYLELINPAIIRRYGEQIGEEGCLSVPEKHCVVSRPMEVTVRYYNRYGKECEITVSGLAARACCHEIDHLNGILFYDNEYVPQGEFKK